MPLNILASGEPFTALLPHALVEHPLPLGATGLGGEAEALGEVDALILSG